MRIIKPRTWLFVTIVALRILPTFIRRARKKLQGKPHHFERSAPRQIPRKIWIYWDSGEENAPELVRDCIASWRTQNPGWDIRVLNSETAAQAVEMPHDPVKLPVQSYADLLRLRLLRQHGGVWVDATTYCLAPLDTWLPVVAQRGFFAFTWTKNDAWLIWPGVRRTLTNWFLASEPAGRFITAWEETSFDYWEGRVKPHNYFWPHIMLDYLFLTSRSFRHALGEIPQIGCFGPHLVHDAVTHGKHIEEISALLQSGSVPVQKLRWNWNAEQVATARALLKIKSAQT
ncbi:capsular polysaccharide synthesis protein [Ruegeria sp. HKCCA5929]|uniref:capsular polysaccharide synthesis protein n=1 Tax=Ruegeria sp. HKCCA5929 TaxID=2682988 RepID=UPI0014880A0C|nr:capsular polysaccharide synthesis protein [Ruegeria sp. HKCCA5929]